jgi:hypothetical protein
LTQAWMADGLFDTFVLLVIESWLPREQQRPQYIQRCFTKVVAMLDRLERDVPGYERLDIAQFRAVGAVQFVRLKSPLIFPALVGVDASFDPLVGRPALSAWIKSTARRKMFREPLIRME